MKTEMALEGFSEITISEQQEINGGIASLAARLIVAAVSAGVTAIIGDWDNFKNGLTGQPEQN